MDLEDNQWDKFLDNIGEDDPDNPYINWLDLNSQEGKDMQDIIAEHTEKDDEGWEDDNTTDEWKKSIPKHLWELGDVFSKKRSERMPARKPYNHSIEFEKEHTLPWAAKLYPLSPKEKNVVKQPEWPYFISYFFSIFLLIFHTKTQAGT